jgi:hypothetical protein
MRRPAYHPHVRPTARVMAARFDPPDALQHYEEWRTLNERIRSGLQPAQMVVDFALGDESDFVRVWLPPRACLKGTGTNDRCVDQRVL